MQKRYKTELLNALALLENIAEESGSYGEQKQAQQKAVELLKTFIENHI